MKRIFIPITSLLLLALSASLTAQGATLEGSLMRLSQFTTSDMANLSSTNYGFSTARSSAMAGAFTSLGADMASMSINPAGLGMYQSSEFSVTPVVTHTKTKSRSTLGYNDRNNITKFNLNNMGAVFNVYQGTGTLTSFSVGLGYNKIADFNYTTGVALENDYSSISQVFMNQLRGYSSSSLNSSSNPFTNNSISEIDWGAVLAYQTGVLDPISGTSNYKIPEWSPSTLTSHYLYVSSVGSVGEYTISMGANLNNVVYVGATVGIQDIYSEQTYQYDETYINNADALNYLLYDQAVRYEGAGVNLKVGIIVRPIDGLRIGLAVHTPTAVTLDRKYIASMNADYSDGDYVSRETATLLSTLDYNSPTRLLAGISYTFSNIGIIAIDYERAWYNGMRLGSSVDDSIRDDWKSAVQQEFKASNNLRIGAEIKPTSNLSLRFGYAYYGNIMSNTDAILLQPVVNNGYNLSAGIGYRFNRFSLDFAYVYMNSTLSAYDLYYYYGENNDGNMEEITSAGFIETTQVKNNFILSMNFRF